MRTKKELRTAGRAARDALTAEERQVKSAQIAETLFTMKEYLEADAIAVYVSFGSELETPPIISRALQDGKRVFCPKVLSVAEHEMEFYEVPGDKGDGSECHLGKQVTFRTVPFVTSPPKLSQLPEPAGDTLPLKEFIERNSACNILFLVPGLAFNPAGARIGYGGGFYDRYLQHLIRPRKGEVRFIALSFACQVFDEPFPETAEDVRIQTILTPDSADSSSSGASRRSSRRRDPR